MQHQLKVLPHSLHILFCSLLCVSCAGHPLIPQTPMMRTSSSNACALKMKPCNLFLWSTQHDLSLLLKSICCSPCASDLPLLGYDVHSSC